MFKEFIKKCQPVDIDGEIFFAIAPKLTPELYSYNGLCHTLELQQQGHIVLSEPEPESGLRFVYNAEDKLVWAKDLLENIGVTQSLISNLSPTH